jgi:hypothetical protein
MTIYQSKVFFKVSVKIIVNYITLKNISLHDLENLKRQESYLQLILYVLIASLSQSRSIFH